MNYKMNYKMNRVNTLQTCEYFPFASMYFPFASMYFKKKIKIIFIPIDTWRVNSFWKIFIFIVEWIKIFSHNTSGGLFKSIEDALSKNVDDPEALLFSRLNQLDDLRSAGGFHFAVCYPELIEGTYSNKSNKMFHMLHYLL